MQHRLRLATGEDAGPIASMSARLIETGLRRSWSQLRVGRHIRSANSIVLTAREDAVLAGFAIMHFSDDSAHLNLLAVEPAYRCRGIGRSLVNWLEKSAVVAGTFIVSLEVRSDNADALGFYSKLGFQETGLLRNYYDGKFDALLLARDLRVLQTDIQLD